MRLPALWASFPHGQLTLPPLGFFVLNIDPVLIRIGPLAVHWYGLMYVVAIAVALYAVRRWAFRLGISDDQIWSLFMWTAIAGLIGGRLYFVVQQPHLVRDYLLNPINIIAVWNGGMAFFGAIFLGTATLFVLAPRYGLSRWVAIDGGALFALVGQIFGRVGNLINGDILGQQLSAGPVSIPANVCTHGPCIASIPDAHLPFWAIVYLNPGSFATPGIAYQPAPIFEMLMNLAMLALLFPWRIRLPQLKAGYYFVAYVFLYGLSQFVVFFARGTEPITPFLGITAFKQAQWTGIVVMLACIPLFLLVTRLSGGWPYSASNPVPWPPADPGAVPAARPAVSTQSTKRQLQPLTKSRVPSAAAAVTAEPSIDLPPWRPTHPVGGALRNVFSPPAGS
jgi:phosphatidylglycerol---prolipoprotein diacylglyceryl transferase